MSLKPNNYKIIIVTFVLALFGFLANAYATVDGQTSDLNSGSTKHNPLDFGTWAIPVLVFNLIFISIIILYHKKHFVSIGNSINVLTNFEISSKITIISVIFIIGVFVGLNSGDIIHSKEESWGDYQRVENAAKYSPLSFFHPEINTGLRYFLLSVSFHIFGNTRIVPFIGSVALLIATYYLTFEITRKRFAGLVAMVVLLQSNLFLYYSTSSTYDNFWTLFYVFSLYVLYKKWYLSPISYILSLFSKPITAIFLPMTFFFIYRSNLTSKEKKCLVISYFVIGFFVALAILTGHSGNGQLGFHPDEFLTGFTSLENFVKFDVLVLVFLLPLTILLFMTSRRGVRLADSIMFLISGTLWSFPLLVVFTGIWNEPYRMIPFIVFVAVGIGTLFAQKRTVVPNNVSTGIFVFTIGTVILFLSFIIFPSLIERHYLIPL